MPSLFKCAIGGVAGLCSVLGARKYVLAKDIQSQRQNQTQRPEKDSQYETERSSGHGGSVTDSPLGSTMSNNTDDQKDLILKLVQVQIFFRHGARTPRKAFEEIGESIYDKKFHGTVIPHTQIPYKVIDAETGGTRPQSLSDERKSSLVFKGGMSAGQLTSLGRHQLFGLGKRIKQRYVNELGLISNEYNTDDIYVRSTNVERTIKSLECVLAGLYGADHFKEPVLIPVSHHLTEVINPNFRNCSTLGHIHSTYYTRLDGHHEYKEITRKINKGLGIDPEHFLEMMKVHDHVIARKTHGLSVPKWLDNFLSDVERGATISLQQFLQGDKSHESLMLRLVVGPMYHLIQENMKLAISDNKSQKLHLYSAHDTSVYPLMLVTGRHTDSWPPYGADVRYELYADNRGAHWVQILFCGQEVIPKGCSQSLLTMEEFNKLVAPYVVTKKQYEHHCSDINVAREFAKYWETAKPDTDGDEATVSLIT